MIVQCVYYQVYEKYSTLNMLIVWDLVIEHVAEKWVIDGLEIGLALNCCQAVMIYPASITNVNSLPLESQGTN